MLPRHLALLLGHTLCCVRSHNAVHGHCPAHLCCPVAALLPPDGALILKDDELHGSCVSLDAEHDSVAAQCWPQP